MTSKKKSNKKTNNKIKSNLTNQHGISVSDIKVLDVESVGVSINNPILKTKPLNKDDINQLTALEKVTTDHGRQLNALLWIIGTLLIVTVLTIIGRIGNAITANDSKAKYIQEKYELEKTFSGYNIQISNLEEKYNNLKNEIDSKISKEVELQLLRKELIKKE